MSDVSDFDRYCGEHAIQPGEEPAAFAAWLHEISSGGWDGKVERVTGPADDGMLTNMPASMPGGKDGTDGG